MNRKHLIISVAVIFVVAAATWVGRSIYRARYNIVTLDVYNAPLAKVIQQLERQTRETILPGKGLEAKVTLTLKNVPLNEALDQLGRQIGASWSK